MTGLKIRNNVAIPTNGEEANLSISLSLEHWAEILSGNLNLSDGLASNLLKSNSSKKDLLAFFANFDHRPLNQ